jgi:CheY-like chemotaxis protein
MTSVQEKVLIVDDEEVVRKLLHQHLSTEGYICQEARYEMNQSELAKRFTDALRHNGDRVYTLRMKGWEVGILHGLVALAADYPGIQKQSDQTHRIIQDFREWCQIVWIDMGLIAQEARLLDELREAGL